MSLLYFLQANTFSKQQKEHKLINESLNKTTTNGFWFNSPLYLTNVFTIFSSSTNSAFHGGISERQIPLQSTFRGAALPDCGGGGGIWTLLQYAGGL